MVDTENDFVPGERVKVSIEGVIIPHPRITGAAAIKTDNGAILDFRLLGMKVEKL